MSRNAKGPWVLIMNNGQPTALAQVIVSFPRSGLTAEEACARYQKSGLDQARNANVLTSVLIRGEPGYAPAPAVDRIRAEIWQFECLQTKLLLDGVLPCEGAGAMMLERTDDDGGWRVVRNYSERRRSGVGVAA